MSEDEDEDILERRARALASSRSEAWAAPAAGEELVFLVRRARYAIATDVVLGVRKLEAISPVPRGVGIAGLTTVDGEIVSVVRLDSVGAGAHAEATLGVVLGKKKPELALLADEVIGIRPADFGSDTTDEAIVRLDGVALLRARSR